MKKTVCVIIFLFIGVANFIYGQFPQKGIKNDAKPIVFVVQQGKDALGSRLAYEVKEKLASSVRYELTTDLNKCWLEITIISVSIVVSGNNIGSAVSITYSYKPNAFYNLLGNLVLIITRRDSIKDDAEDIVATLDEYYQKKRMTLELFDKIWETGIINLDKEKKEEKKL